jgi:hypothetical protein
MDRQMSNELDSNSSIFHHQFLDKVSSFRLAIPKMVFLLDQQKHG